MSVQDPGARPDLITCGDAEPAHLVGANGLAHDVGNRRIEAQRLEQDIAQPWPVGEVLERMRAVGCKGRDLILQAFAARSCRASACTPPRTSAALSSPSRQRTSWLIDRGFQHPTTSRRFGILQAQQQIEQVAMLCRRWVGLALSNNRSNGAEPSGLEALTFPECKAESVVAAGEYNSNRLGRPTPST